MTQIAMRLARLRACQLRHVAVMASAHRAPALTAAAAARLQQQQQLTGSLLRALVVMLGCSPRVILLLQALRT
jgi:hypothetical protein